MPIPQTTIDELKSVARIEDVIEEFGHLNPKKPTQADCPKCGGKDKVSIPKGMNIATCFKCDHTGKTSTLQPISMLMDPDYGNMTYPDALKWLGEKYNIIVEDEPEVAKPVGKPAKKKRTDSSAPQAELGMTNGEKEKVATSGKPDRKTKTRGPLRPSRPGPQVREGKLSFRDKQLQSSGIEEDDQVFKLKEDENTKVIRNRYTKGSLDPNKDFEINELGDDMIMHYVGLDDELMTFVPDKGRSKKERPFIRVRHANPEEHQNKQGEPIKYKSHFGSGIAVWCPERIRTLFKAFAQFNTFGIQEGEKKADRSCKAGVLSVGINGINGLSLKNKPFPLEYGMIIKRANVKNMFFLMDSDWDQLGKGKKDLDSRPWLFYSAVRKYLHHFRTYANAGIELNIYWGYVNKNEAGAKGIDDLLESGICTDEEYAEDVANALQGKSTKFITLHDITLHKDQDLRAFWHLNDPKDFIQHYKSDIMDMGLKEFKVGRMAWRFDQSGNPEMAQALEPAEQFWEVRETKSGNQNIQFRSTKAREFLQSRGYGMYTQASGEPIHIHIEGGIIEEVRMDAKRNGIKDFVQNFLRAHEPRNYLLRDAFYDNGETWLGLKPMSSIYELTPMINEDTYDSQHLYFKNCCLRIDPKGITPHQFGNTGGFVWKERIIDFNIHLLEKPMFEIKQITNELLTTMNKEDRAFFKNKVGMWALDWSDDAADCDYFDFLFNASNFYWRKENLHFDNPEENPDLTREEKWENNQHLLSKLTMFGHMLHSHRSAHNEYIPILMEGVNVEGGRSEGRSGKGVCVKALQHMNVVEEIDGKKDRLDSDPFLFGNVTERTQCVVIDDVRKNFNIEWLFQRTTGSFKVRPMHRQEFTIPYDKSPKMLVTTNFALQEKGGSFTDRRKLVAFSDFFSVHNKPQEHYGHLFFDEWEEPQWNLFFNLMASCLQLYFKVGHMVQAPTQRMEQRILQQEIGESFERWAEDYYQFSFQEDANYGHLNKRETKEEVFQACRKAMNNPSWLDIRVFKKKLWQYALYKELLINPSQPYGTKVNGKLDPARGSMKAFYHKPYGGDLKVQGTEYVELYTRRGWAENKGIKVDDDLPF